jgi:hypothetical protein
MMWYRIVISRPLCQLLDTLPLDQQADAGSNAIKGPHRHVNFNPFYIKSLFFSQTSSVNQFLCRVSQNVNFFVEIYLLRGPARVSLYQLPSTSPCDWKVIVTMAVRFEIDQACQTIHAACVLRPWKKNICVAKKGVAASRHGT